MNECVCVCVYGMSGRGELGYGAALTMLLLWVSH